MCFRVYRFVSGPYERRRTHCSKQRLWTDELSKTTPPELLLLDNKKELTEAIRLGLQSSERFLHTTYSIVAGYSSTIGTSTSYPKSTRIACFADTCHWKRAPPALPHCTMNLNKIRHCTKSEAPLRCGNFRSI